MSISDSLTLLNNTKTAIKDKINELGGTVQTSTPFADYPAKIEEVAKDVYQRPSNWLALPAVINTEQKMVGLYAVFNHTLNMIAIKCQGAYTVDWGDGVVQDYATNAKAEHLYDYATLPAETLTSAGYKQAIIVVTPQAGNNLTLIDIYQKYTGWTTPTYSTNWLDITISAPNLSSLVITATSPILFHNMLERFALISDNLLDTTDFSSLLYGLESLRSVSLVVNSATYLTSTVYGCTKLIEASIYKSTQVVNWGSTFRGCSSLRTVSIEDTSNVTSYGSTFYGCGKLKVMPQLNFAKATILISTFYGSGIENATIDAPFATTMANIFQNCSSLENATILNSNLVTDMTNMFNYCTSLKTVAALNTSSCTLFAQMFQGCRELVTLPTLDSSKVTSFNALFSGCYALQTIPALDMSAGTANASFSSMFSNCLSLSKAPVYGAKYAFGFTSVRLSTEEIVVILEGLPTVASVSISFTNCWGAAALTAEQIAIGTNKGWTVTR